MLKQRQKAIKIISRGNRSLVINPVSGNWGIYPKEKEKTAIEKFEKKQKEYLRNSGAAPATYRTLTCVIRTIPCNLRCRYCFVSSGQGRGMLNFEAMAKIIKAVLNFPRYEEIYFLFIGGEPALNWKSIEETVAFFTEQKKFYKKKFSFAIFTNGTLINQKIVDFAKEYNLSFCLSLDGPEEIHDRNRVYSNGKGSFKNTMRGYQLLMKNGINPGVMTTISDPKETFEVFDFFKREGIYRMNLRHGRFQGRGRRYEFVSNEYQTDLADQHLKIIDKVIDHNKTQIPKIYVYNLIYRAMNLVLEERPFMCLRSPCGAGSGTKLGFDGNGDIYPCDTMAGIKELAIGNIKNFTDSKGLQHIIKNSPIMAKIKNRVVENIQKCSICTWRKFCCGECTAVSYSKYKSLEREGDRCIYESRLFEGLLWKLTEDANNYLWLVEPDNVKEK